MNDNANERMDEMTITSVDMGRVGADKDWVKFLVTYYVGDAFYIRRELSKGRKPVAEIRQEIRWEYLPE